MAQPLRLHIRHRPTLFNEDMLLGGLLGAITLGVAGIGIGAAIMAGGALIGGFIGKRQIVKENHIGKKVGQPNFWNKDALLGGLLGNVIGLMAGTALLAAAMGVGVGDVLAGALPQAEAMQGSMLAGMSGLLASWIGGISLGTWLGGKRGEWHMTKEYHEAKKQFIYDELAKGATIEISNPAYGKEIADRVFCADIDKRKDTWSQEAMEDKLLKSLQPQQVRR